MTGLGPSPGLSSHRAPRSRQELGAGTGWDSREGAVAAARCEPCGHTAPCGQAPQLTEAAPMPTHPGPRGSREGGGARGAARSGFAVWLRRSGRADLFPGF